MAILFTTSFYWTVVTPTTGLGAWQVVPSAQHLGLGEFGRAVAACNIVGATGGTLDIVIQTHYYAGGGTNGWKDIARFTQLASGATAQSWVVPVTRVGSGTTAAPITANITDLAPIIPQNTIYGQSMGDSLRLIVMPGVGTTAGATLTFAWNATP